MPKTKPIPKAKAKTLRHQPPPKPRRKVRLREAKPAKPAKKASTAMTTAAAAEPRGAGTGQEANATRARKYTEDTKYTPGDAAKGRIDPEDLTLGQVATQIAMRDRRAYLINQAEKNEAANDELNAIQVDQNKRVQLVQNLLQDPDEMRDSSMETAVLMLKMHDPDERKKQVAAKQKLADSRTERVEGRQAKRLDEGK